MRKYKKKEKGRRKTGQTEGHPEYSAKRKKVSDQVFKGKRETETKSIRPKKETLPKKGKTRLLTVMDRGNQTRRSIKKQARVLQFLMDSTEEDQQRRSGNRKNQEKGK